MVEPSLYFYVSVLYHLCVSDWEQRLIGSCTESEIACTVQVTVMSHYPSKGHMVIDSGWTGMSLDKDKNETGFGAVVRETDLE